MKRIFGLLLIIMMIVLMVACNGATNNSIVGKWYNGGGKCLDIRSDNSWELEGSYGTGTWKLLDDKVTYEFTDVYGDTQKSKINTDDDGQYIDFGYYGNFYKKEIANNILNAETSNQNEIAVTLIKCGDFSEGVAWIIYTQNNDSTKHLGLINTDGKILYKEEATSTFLPPEMSGVSYVEQGDTDIIIDKNGNVVASLNNIYDRIEAIGDNYILVYKYGGPKESKHLVATLNSTGELVSDFVSLDYEPGMSKYLGCGMFSIPSSGTGGALYNAQTGAITYISASPSEYVNELTYFPSGCYFTDKRVGNYLGFEKMSAVSVDTNYNKKDIPDFTYATNGMLVICDRKAPISILDTATGNKRTLDYDTSQHRSIKYANDYGLLTLGADGRTFFTLLDRQGSEIIEPVQYWRSAKYSEGMIVYGTNEYSNVYNIMDTQGNILAEGLRYEYVGEFYDGFAVVKTEGDDYYYINERGEKVLDLLHE